MKFFRMLNVGFSFLTLTVIAACGPSAPRQKDASVIPGQEIKENPVPEPSAASPPKVSDNEIKEERSLPRNIRVCDSRYEENSYRVTLDQQLLGVTPNGGCGEYAVLIDTGSHRLVLELVDGYRFSGEFLVSLVSGTSHPIYFEEPKSASPVSYDYRTSGGEVAEEFGKQYADGPISLGHSVTLNFVVSRKHPGLIKMRK